MYRDPHEHDVGLPLHYGDLTDESQLARLIRTALLAKIHQFKVDDAATVEVWGTGTPRREFLYVDDLADAVVFATRYYIGEEHLNVGVGTDLPIADLARAIAQVVGWEGELAFNTDVPDGTPRKLVDTSRPEQLGWTASIGLREGLADTYRWYLGHVAEPAGR